MVYPEHIFPEHQYHFEGGLYVDVSPLMDQPVDFDPLFLELQDVVPGDVLFWLRLDYSLRT